MRGGPINTRRVTIDDPIKEVTDLITKEEGWQKSLANKQVTFVVYRENDQLNFFRVIDRGDGTLTPLSESMSGGSVCNVYAEEEEEEEEEDGESSAATQQSLENSITMNKMKLLKAKMEDMNLSKKPKKSAKVKPRPPVNPKSCVGSLAATSSTRHHHRLFRSLSQMNQPWPSNAQLPPIADHESVDPFSLSAAATSAHFSASRRAPPPFTSPSCYMLREEEPWETCPSFAKIRPPPKVSRLDIGGTRLMRDCVYPQLPPLCIRGPPEANFDPAEPAGEAVGLSLLEEAAGLMAPVQPGTPFGELSDPLSLDVSSQPDGRRSLGVGAPPLCASPLGTWTLGPSDALTSGYDGSHLGTPFSMRSPSPSASTGPLPLAFEPDLQAQVKPGGTSPHLPATASAHPLAIGSVKVESPGKRPGLISKREARSITQMANQACKEPVGSLNHSEVLASRSTRAADGDRSRDSLREMLGLPPASPPYSASGPGSLGSRLPSIPANRLLQHNPRRQMSPLQRAAASSAATGPLASAVGVMTSFGRLGAPTYHLPPVKAPAASKKKSSKHCFLCGKKTGLATSYECRCGHNFCCTHRYAETHDCTYDYKGAGRRLLQETNPLVSAPKLPKI
ncbi:AN1-type zinc finger protein 4 isoform 2-T4 [Spinachia spinachia]